MDSGHTAWMLTASALVFFMTPGLAFFYGGLVRAKSLVNTIILSFITIGVVTIVWTLWGYSLAYGDGELIPSFVGDFSLLGYQIEGHIFSNRGGHESNIKFLK